jgi:hypothetical protein
VVNMLVHKRKRMIRALSRKINAKTQRRKGAKGSILTPQ